MKIEGHTGYSNMLVYIQNDECKLRVFKTICELWKHVSELAFAKENVNYLVVIENGIVKEIKSEG